MDIKCPKCREPFDMDCIHDEISERWPDQPWKVSGKHDQELYERDYYDVVQREFRSRGCSAFSAMGFRCPAEGQSSDPVIDATYDLMGDDLDGAASMLEDAEQMGLL